MPTDAGARNAEVELCRSPQPAEKLHFGHVDAIYEIADEEAVY